MKFSATHIVHCPTGPTHACETHARQIQSLMSVLGAHVAIELSDGEHECNNCKNEAKEGVSKNE